MKFLKKTSLLLCILLPLAFVACDDGEETGGTDTTMTAGDATSSTEGDTTATEGDATSTEGDATETDTTEGDTTMTTGECQNAGDQDLIANADPSPSDAAASCGQGCVADPDPSACTVTCMKMAGSSVETITDSCAGCYADSVACTINDGMGNSCVGDCLADPSSQACSDCRFANGCTTRFFVCSGETGCGDLTCDADEDATTCPDDCQ